MGIVEMIQLRCGIIFVIVLLARSSLLLGAESSVELVRRSLYKTYNQIETLQYRFTVEISMKGGADQQRIVDFCARGTLFRCDMRENNYYGANAYNGNQLQSLSHRGGTLTLSRNASHVYGAPLPHLCMLRWLLADVVGPAELTYGDIQDESRWIEIFKRATVIEDPADISSRDSKESPRIVRLQFPPPPLNGAERLEVDFAEDIGFTPIACRSYRKDGSLISAIQATNHVTSNNAGFWIPLRVELTSAVGSGVYVLETDASSVKLNEAIPEHVFTIDTKLAKIIEDLDVIGARVEEAAEQARGFSREADYAVSRGGSARGLLFWVNVAAIAVILALLTRKLLWHKN